MKKSLERSIVAYSVLVVILGFFLGVIFCELILPERSMTQEIQQEQMFDTSIIETNWCGEAEDGTIRMVGAWIVADDNGLYTLEDETGNLWEVADVAIYEDDFLLLWIADCGTPEVEDDLILKCWAEVH